MSYRTKNDINYFKFLELSKRIVDDKDARHILEEAYVVFEPKNINRLARAMEVEGPLKSRFVLDLDFDKVGGAGRFIDADMMHVNEDFKGLFSTILKPKRKFFFWRYDLEKDLSLREAEAALKKWIEFRKEIKSNYDYIYNPPARIQSGNTMNTQGSFERQAFAEMYGGYMEMR